MRKIVPIVFWAVLLCVAVFLVPLVNNVCAMVQLHSLQTVELPQQTVALEYVCEVGRFTGTGNGAQYFTAMLVKSELTQETLGKWYEPYGCKVEQQVSQEIAALERGGLILGTALDSEAEYYIVYSLKDGVPPFSWLDIRGA